MEITLRRIMKIALYGLLAFVAFIASTFLGGSKYYGLSQGDSVSGGSVAHADTPTDVGSSDAGSFSGGGSGGCEGSGEGGEGGGCEGGSSTG